MRQNILFLGDSHTAAVMVGMRNLRPEFRILGHGLPLGPEYPVRFHSAGKPLVFLHDAAQKQLQSFLAATGLETGDLLDIDFPVVYCLSGITQMSPLGVWSIHRPYFDPDKPLVRHVSAAYYEEAFTAYYGHLLDFYARLVAAGRTPVVVMAPAPHYNHIRLGYLNQLARDHIVPKLIDVGAKVVDISASTTDEQGILLQQYRPPEKEDYIHANPHWGELAAREICAQLAL